MFRSLRHRDYRLYWSGMFVSNAGTWMQRVAQDWLVLVTLGGGAQAVGITTGLQFLPFLLAAPFGGVLADRLPKRQLLIATNTFMGTIGLLLGALVLSGSAEIWHVYVLAFLGGLGTAIDNPARQAYVSELVGPDDITNAIALNSTSFNAARMVGPAVAGVLIALLGPGLVFVLNGLSFAAPIVGLLMIRPNGVRQRDEEAAGPLSHLADGVRYVRGRRDLLMVMLVMFGVGTFGMNFQMTMALMSAEVYHRGPSAYGLLGTVMAVGTLTGALIAARRKFPRRRLILGAAVAFGSLELAAGLMPTYELFALMLVPVGVLVMTVLTSANAYIQTSVPAEMRGRVLSLYLMVLMGGTPLGAPIIGWVAGELGPRWSLLGGGLLTVACTVLAFAVYRTRGAVKATFTASNAAKVALTAQPASSG
jgi:MFS family permease